MEKLTQEVLDRLYSPVGEFIVTWGMLDIMIQYVAFSMFKAKGTTPTAQGWPVGLGHRLSILEDRFKKWPEVKELKDDAAWIFKHMRKEQQLRDMLAHGAAVRYDRGKDAVLFRRIDRSSAAQRKRSPEQSHQPSNMLIRFSTLATSSANGAILTERLIRLSEKVKTVKQPK
jgi:hypothetical protein